MSFHSDFFPPGGDDLIPGDVIDTPDNYIADGINYIDITNGVTISQSTFPDLDANLFVPNWSSTSLQQEINNPTAVISDYFGKSVSLYGDTLVVGAYFDDIGASNAGSVYVYTRSGTTWTLQQEINNPSPTIDDFFGHSVSLYGDTLVVGAYAEDTGASNAGSVYVYTRSGTTWSLQQEINNPEPAIDDYFGNSVAIYGDTMVAGAYGDDTGATDAGSVYVYVRSGSTWLLQQEINNPSPVAGDWFGYSVSLYGDTLLVGAYGEDTGASAAGSAYVYTRSGTTWTLQQEINNPSPVAGDSFGYNVSLYGDTLVVGAYLEDTGAAAAGSVYVYVRSGSTWSLQQEINNPNPAIDDRFGYAVSLYNDILTIGAYYDTSGTVGGSAYVYTRSGTTWSLQQEINNPNLIANDFFGAAISVYQDTLLVGAYGEDTGASSAGSVYIFSPTEAGTFYIQGTDKVLKVKK